MRKYYTHIVLILLALVLYFMANFQRVAIPGAIFDTLQQDLNLSASSVTALSACFMYSYAVSLLFCGILSDRYGAVKVIMCGALLFSHLSQRNHHKLTFMHQGMGNLQVRLVDFQIVID